MSLQKLRSGVKQFDAQWNGTVPTNSVFDNSPVILVCVSRKSQWWNDPKYLALGLTAQHAVDGLLAREQDEYAWVYVVRHNRPKTRDRVTHGYIVCDDQRFPVWVIPDNRRKESKQILDAIKFAIDSIAWDELDTALQKRFENAFDWDGLVEDVENNPFFDEYGNDEIVGRAFVCTFPVLRELGETLTYKLLERAENDREDFGETAQYVDEQLEESLEAVAEKHGLHVFVEDNDVFLTKTLLEEKDDVRIKNSKIFEWEEYPDGYGHVMASEPEIAEFTFEPGSMAVVTKIVDVDDIRIELYHDEHGTFFTDVEFAELEPLTNH